MFENILNQDRPIRLLTSLLHSKTIPHALLFTGIDGIGKRRCSIAFAMLCNCADLQSGSVNSGNNRINPCGNCSSCKKIKSGNHPDVITIKPSGTYIKIDQIRELCSLLSLKPYEANLRVIIISDAQTMTVEAGNALLKELEEPPSGTIFILTATQKSDMLPTILSRTQSISFNPFPLKDIIAILEQKHGVSHNDATILAAMANGSLAKAIAMSGSGRHNHLITQRKWLINILSEFITSEPMTAQLLAFALRLSKNKDFFLDSLMLIKTWLRDIIICRYCSEKVINKDIIAELKQISAQVTVESILNKIQIIDAAQKNILGNANLRLTSETMIIKFVRV